MASKNITVLNPLEFFGVGFCQCGSSWHLSDVVRDTFTPTLCVVSHSVLGSPTVGTGLGDARSNAASSPIISLILNISVITRNTSSRREPHQLLLTHLTGSRLNTDKSLADEPCLPDPHTHPHTRNANTGELIHMHTILATCHKDLLG